MVAVNVGKSQLGVVRCFLGFVRSTFDYVNLTNIFQYYYSPDETLRHREHGNNGEDLIAAVVLTAGN